MEKLNPVIKRDCHYGKIYRDDSLIVLKGVLAVDEVEAWKDMFCELVNEEMPCMVFTVAKWNNGLDFLDLFLWSVGISVFFSYTGRLVMSHNKNAVFIRWPFGYAVEILKSQCI